MRSLIFDTGPIISLTLNHLAWALENLKGQFQGDFFITKAVKEELVDRPLETKRFKFEALHTLRLIRKDLLKVYEEDLTAETQGLLDLANNTFKAKGNFINICHVGEMEVLALALKIQPEAVVIDERTTRELVEDPHKVKAHLEKRLHTNVEVNNTNFDALRKKLSGIKVIRSIELAIACYEMGLLDRYLPEGEHAKETLLDSILWGMKLNGCAISADDILQIIQEEVRTS